jgi:hypothetical protein
MKLSTSEAIRALGVRFITFVEILKRPIKILLSQSKLTATK